MRRRQSFCTKKLWLVVMERRNLPLVRWHKLITINRFTRLWENPKGCHTWHMTVVPTGLTQKVWCLFGFSHSLVKQLKVIILYKPTIRTFFLSIATNQNFQWKTLASAHFLKKYTNDVPYDVLGYVMVLKQLKVKIMHFLLKSK